MDPAGGRSPRRSQPGASPWLRRLLALLFAASLTAAMAAPGGPPAPGKGAPQRIPVRISVKIAWTDHRDCSAQDGQCKSCRDEGALTAEYNVDVESTNGIVWRNAAPGSTRVKYLNRTFCPVDGEMERTDGQGDAPIVPWSVLSTRGNRLDDAALPMMVDRPAGGLNYGRHLLAKHHVATREEGLADGRRMQGGLLAGGGMERELQVTAPFRKTGYEARADAHGSVGVHLFLTVAKGQTSGSLAWEERGMNSVWDLIVVQIQGLSGGSNHGHQDGTEEDSNRVVRYTVSWSFAPVDGQTEVSVEPEGYDDWIPEGNLAKPGDMGNRIKVRLKVHRKGDPGTPQRARLTLDLTKVSMEKGVCMNWPTAGAKPDYGLRLLAAENPGLEVLGPDQARTRGPVESLDLVVSAHDFGAYGVLRVTATDLQGQEAKVKVRGQDKADLALPKDENHNHVADAWESAWAGGLRGQETDDEDAQPAGDGHAGDALSLYEEYRGFRITGGPELTGSGGRPQERITGAHVRTNPRVKDVFVCDTLGMGLGAFRASGLQVHLVKPEECGRSQSGAYNPHSINPNRGRASTGEQYVLWMESGSTGNGYAGEAVMKGGEPSVPRDCRRILVGAPVAAGSPWLRPDQETLVTLTHELAHACNVKHHGDGGSVDVVRSERLADHAVESGVGLLVTEGGGSQASGDVHCYMGYTPNFVQEQKDPEVWVWDKAGNRYTARKWNPNSPRFTKYRFCDAGAQVELGPAGPAAAGRGDCVHRFCVNHLKH